MQCNTQERAKLAATYGSRFDAFERRGERTPEDERLLHELYGPYYSERAQYPVVAAIELIQRDLACPFDHARDLESDFRAVGLSWRNLETYYADVYCAEPCACADLGWSLGESGHMAHDCTKPQRCFECGQTGLPWDAIPLGHAR